MAKTAVILFNLGGPDSLDAVKPFLFNLFNDPAIISAPKPIRYLLARLISSRRERVAQEIYSHIGDKSPIEELTRKQSTALENQLNLREKGQQIVTEYNAEKQQAEEAGQKKPKNDNIEVEAEEYKSFVCMRYWHPRADEVIKEVKLYNPDQIVLLPLYPQFSTTTTGSSLTEWKEIALREGLDVPTKTVCCYPTKGEFIRAHADLIREDYKKAEHFGVPRILFSAHGLPKKIINKGDPYQWQVEQTAEAIVELLNIADLDYQVCYQSKVGPLEWIGPSTEEEIIRAAEDGGVSLVIVPIAFVSEHSETLVELDIEYKNLAQQNGLKYYYRVPALGDHPLFIKALADLCVQSEHNASSITSYKNTRICPQTCTSCPCQSN